MAYRSNREPRSSFSTRLRDRVQVPIVFEIESDDPCLLCDANADDGDDGIVSCPVEVVLVDMLDALA